MAAIALTIIILLNYLALYYAYGAIKGSVRTKKKRFFSRQKSRRCAPGGGAIVKEGIVLWFVSGNFQKIRKNPPRKFFQNIQRFI